MQNWNNLLNYIETNLGLKNNFIELTREEIVDYIKNNTLVEISQHTPNKAYVKIESCNNITRENDYSKNVYEIPYTDKFLIIEVDDVYYNDKQFNDTELFDNGYTFYDPRDAIISNTYYNMLRSLGPYSTFQFVKPNIIRFSSDIKPPVILELSIQHISPESIPSDIYNLIFKKMALRDVIDIIIPLRNKYKELSTPFATIDVNIDFLNTLRDRLTTELDDKIKNIPPKILVAFF